MRTAFGKGKTTLTGPIIDGFCIRQLFIAKASRLSSVAILLSTYKRKNPGQIFVELRDIRGQTICTDSVLSADLVDNAYHPFNLAAELITGRTYEVMIRTVHCRAGMAATAHYGAKVHDGHLFVGSRLARGGEMVCRFEYGDVEMPAVPLAVAPGTLEEAPVVATMDEDGHLMDFLREPMSSLSVIILNKDGYDLITECVLALLENTKFRPMEIIIGDTGTTDDRVWDFYKKMRPNGVEVVQDLEYHFSKANNLLVNEFAQGTHLLFLNNDVFLQEGAVDTMMQASNVYKAGAVGLRLMKPRGVIDHDGQVLYSKGHPTVPGHLNINRPPKDAGLDDIVTQGVTAACMLTRRSLFSAAGGFDERYEDVYQDCDYCLKLNEMGFNCFTVRSTGATHVGSATRGPTTSDRESVTRDRDRYMARWKTKTFSDPTPMFSFVTCCNNPDLYYGMMETLPERFTDDVEFIPISNYGNPLTVTQALNLGAKFAHGRYIVYCHQDVKFTPNWFSAMVTALSALPDERVGVIGFEGIQDGGTPRTCKSTPMQRPVEVQTLDELCLVTPRRDLKFDERFKFHYYGTDICMEARRLGLQNYLVGAVVRHLSGGKENIMADPVAFRAEVDTFIEKWGNARIWTTTTNFADGKASIFIAPELNR